MQCVRCGHRKPKNKPCKECERRKCQRYKRSPKGILNDRYRHMILRSEKRGWPVPDFTQDQFMDKYLKNSVFLQLHKDWAMSGYEKELTPSLDRKNAKLPYTRDNIQWLTWKENLHKSASVDHRQFYQDLGLKSQWIKMTSEEKEGLRNPKFSAKGVYSYVIGGFMITRKEIKKVVVFQTKEQADDACIKYGHPRVWVHRIGWHTGGAQSKGMGFAWAIMHPLSGFMTK